MCYREPKTVFHKLQTRVIFYGIFGKLILSNISEVVWQKVVVDVLLDPLAKLKLIYGQLLLKVGATIQAKFPVDLNDNTAAE